MSEETTLLIKIPKDLKVLYQALCKTKGVTVSSQLRDFIRSEISYATMPQNPARKPQNDVLSPSNDNSVPKQRQSYKNAIQADLELSDTASSAINAAKSRKKSKKRKR